MKTIKLIWFLRDDDDDDDDDVNGKKVHIYFVDFEKAFDIVLLAKFILFISYDHLLSIDSDSAVIREKKNQ